MCRGMGMRDCEWNPRTSWCYDFYIFYMNTHTEIGWFDIQVCIKHLCIISNFKWSFAQLSQDRINSAESNHPCEIL